MPSIKKLSRVFFVLIVLGAGVYAVADNAVKPTKVALSSPQETTVARSPAPALSERNEYVLGAPPSGRYAEQAAMYQPVAEFLSRVTGKRVLYRPADNWLSYSRDMTASVYDIVFDSAALNSWRIERMDHTLLVRVPDELIYAVVARADNAKVTQLKQLAGKTVCSPLAPDVAALALLSQFNNPARQPVIVEQNGPGAAYRGMIDGKCVGSVVRLEEADPALVKVLYRHRPLPNHAFSAGPRLSSEVKARIRDSLMSPAGHQATARLRAAHGGKRWTAASGAEYAGFGKLLKGTLYYY